MAMGIWIGAVGVTLLLGWRTTAGPVLIAFTVKHGVHLSDLAVAVNAATGAALLTHRLASSPPCQRASTSGAWPSGPSSPVSELGNPSAPSS